MPVRVISGKVLLQRGKIGEKLEDVSTISDALIGLFTEEGHRLVTSVEADRDGRFKLRPVPAGRYRLVVRDPTCLLCIANVPLRVLPPSRAGKLRRDILIIHMRAGGIDDCSYGDFK
jgi:hypothetical protein